MSERSYNTSRYIYTGPTMLLPWAKPSENVVNMSNGAEVVAEMNIGKATVIAVHKLDRDFMTEPTYIASEYLKPKPIRFAPADDVDVPHFFDNLFSDIAKINAEHYMPFFNDMAFSNKTIIDKWAEEHKQDVENNYAKIKQWEKIKNEDLDNLRVRDYIFGSGKENIEVGGQHYQTAIQPWDFIYANKIPFDEANCIKYLCRHKDKGGAEDIRKVISYCKHILKTQYDESE